ncbi:MAG: MarR family transcriptional regulator [Treponema sp.]|nr:MarR family transcriptional regulator [Treponema sp.]
MNQENYECLKLDNQLCFPLYAASREILRLYTPFLSPLDLTYTQYIVLMVLWEKENMTVGELGKKLFLDTGTLSPLLKSMEKKNLVKRERAKQDERVVTIAITQEGMSLKEKAREIPLKVGNCLKVSPEEAEQLYRILYKILGVDK